MEKASDETQTANIHNLPEEVIERILSFLSPYNDLCSARLVSKLWNRMVKGIIHHKNINFCKGLRKSRFRWQLMEPLKATPKISERYSHCACYHDKSLYVFGGCTSTNTNTTFNDLWRYNLETDEWIRPLAMGTYPSPKACASLVAYENTLILFGGWTHPSPYPLHQAALFFNELHIYTPERNRWSLIQTPSSPPPTAGHSASIIDDYMLVFGGCQSPGIGCNDTWVYDLVLSDWLLPDTTSNKPQPRYGQSQCVIQKCLLILGGCGGPNQIFNDLWLLDISTDIWTWFEIEVGGIDYAPSQLWCHQACKVGDCVVVLRKPTSVIQTKLDEEKAQKTVKSASLQRISPRVPDRREGRGYQMEPRSKSDGKHGESSANLRDCDGTIGSDDPNSSDVPIGDRPRAEHESVDLPGRTLVRNFQENLHCEKCSQHSKLRVDKTDGGLPSCSSERRSAEHNETRDASAVCVGNNHAAPADERDGHGSERVDGESGTPQSPGGAAVPHSEQPCKKMALEPSSSLRRIRSPFRRDFARNRQKQLDMLQKYSDRIRQLSGAAASPVPPATPAEGVRGDRRATMCLYVLDIDAVLSHHRATWLAAPTYSRLPCHLSSPPPEETVFYSLTLARSELLLFGGMHRDLSSLSLGTGRSCATANCDFKPHTITNALYRIAAQDAFFT